MGMTIYLVGCLVALLFCILDYFGLKPEERKDAQLEMACPVILLSWISVGIFLYREIF